METNEADILIIDDDDDVRRSMELLLKSKGFKHIDSASDAAEGLKKAAKHNYDLILLDMIMPKTSGWGALKKIAAMKISTRVLVVSAVGLPEAVERELAIEYPPVSFLAKTRVTSELAGKIKEMLLAPASTL